MAATSHSIPVPNPRNPEQTSNSVRPEVLSLSKGEGPDGRPGFDILLRQGYGGQALSPNGILDRRTLLTGAGIGCLIPLIPLIRRPFDAACGVAQDRLDRRIHRATASTAEPWTRRSSRRVTSGMSDGRAL